MIRISAKDQLTDNHLNLSLSMEYGCPSRAPVVLNKLYLFDMEMTS